MIWHPEFLNSPALYSFADWRLNIVNLSLPVRYGQQKQAQNSNIIKKTPVLKGLRWNSGGIENISKQTAGYTTGIFSQSKTREPIQ